MLLPYPNLCETHYSIVSSPSSLQKLCWGTDPTDRHPDINGGIQHILTRREIVETALSGCRLCRAILISLKFGSTALYLELEPNGDKFLDHVLEGVDEDEMDNALILWIAYITRDGGTWHDVHKLVVYRSNEDRLPPQILAEMEIYVEEDNPAARYVSARPINSAVFSDNAFAKARSWIGNCINFHSECQHLENLPLPTRVIDVSPSDGTAVSRIYCSHGESAHYITLSYCWGGQQTLMSTTKTISQNMQALVPSALPQTIQDAILVTRKLGCRYLWVDALCILQDSPEDKNREIGKMASIYKNAYCTISAASAESAWVGFLQTRPRLGADGDWFKVPYCCPDGVAGTMYIRPEAKYSAAKEPISLRAWTLQEQLLSPRILIYDSYRLRWECGSLMDSDGGGLNLIRNTDFGRVPRSGNAKLTAKEEEKLQRFWWITISNYAKRQLTVPNDKLSAVSAFAEEYSRLSGDTYLAGHWKRQLGSSLMWSCQVYTGDKSCRTSSHRPAKYRAPSWSWASLDHEILSVTHPYPTDIEVLEYSVSPVSKEAPFAEVTNATLTVGGLINEAAWIGTSQTSGYVPLWNATKAIRIGQCAPDCFAVLPGVGESERLWCLVVKPTPITESTQSIEGLVLRKAGAGTFERVGTFQIILTRLPDWLRGCSRQNITIV